jgi:hypothetical protein
MNLSVHSLLMAGFFLLFFYGSTRICAVGLKTGKLPYRDPWNLKWFPPPDRKKNRQWFWFNFILYALLSVGAWLALALVFSKAFQNGLTPRSSRTPPALPSALCQHFAIPAPLVASVQAWPLSFIR